MDIYGFMSRHIRFLVWQHFFRKSSAQLYCERYLYSYDGNSSNCHSYMHYFLVLLYSAHPKKWYAFYKIFRSQHIEPIISRWLMSHHAICQDYIMVSLVCVQIYMVCKVATCGIYTIDPIFWTIMIQVFALHISSLYVYINRKQGLIYVDDLLYICMANIVTSDYIHLLKA